MIFNNYFCAFWHHFNVMLTYVQYDLPQVFSLVINYRDQFQRSSCIEIWTLEQSKIIDTFFQLLIYFTATVKEDQSNHDVEEKRNTSKIEQFCDMSERTKTRNSTKPVSLRTIVPVSLVNHLSQVSLQQLIPKFLLRREFLYQRPVFQSI